jgi:adenosylmethionine-8-amino-7-oxononanoate aminotransferase
LEELSREQVVELDKRRVWHPYTEMSEYRAKVSPLVIVRAQGSRLFDADGRSFVDGNASWWTATLGHCHPRLVAALERQAADSCHTALGGMTHPTAALLAERLCEVTPTGLDHVFFSDNGSTAVEVAMKLALQYWQQNGRPERTRFAALEHAFHGDTLGVTALGGVEVFRRPFAPTLLDCAHLPSPAEPGGEAEAVEALRKVVAAEAETLAGLVFEPLVQGAAGMQMYSPDYLAAAREICDEHDVFLIFDEVFTGYGRTGCMWAGETAGVVPDIQCMAKGFSGGMMPMAGTVSTERIFEGFLGEPERAFYYGHTFCGNPLGSAIALEVLRVFEEERILENARAKAQRIAGAFEEMAGWSGVSRTRSLGMIGALDLEGDEGYLSDAGWRVYDQALELGVYLRPLGNVVYVTPPLNIPDADLDQLLQVLQQSVAAVAKAL